MTVIAMSRTEIDRMSVLRDLAASRIKVTEAATLMCLSRAGLSQCGRTARSPVFWRPVCVCSGVGWSRPLNALTQGLSSRRKLS
jgi:hypothetical protein